MTTQLSYAPSSVADIPNLAPFFGPDAPPLPDADPMPDAMQQNPCILHIMQILTDLRGSPDVLVDTNTTVYYDPANGNRRIQPDVCVAFGADADAIYRRNGYVIWEAGKPPDFALEIASESTADHDVGYKRDRYAALEVAEYWQFDASGGNLYGAALVGEYLDNGAYPPFPVRTAPDGAIWGYSPLLHLNLRWNAGRLELQDPDTNEILLDRRGMRLAKELAEAGLREREEMLQEQSTALAEYQAMVRQLQEQLLEQEEPG